MWVNQNFLLEYDLKAESALNVAFLSLRDNSPLVFKMDSTGRVSIEGNM